MSTPMTLVVGAKEPAAALVPIWENSKVTLLALPLATMHTLNGARFMGEASDAERLVELAGRFCYMSHRNPADKTTEEYIANLLRQEHGSVLEHANFTVLIEGISRSCSHEIVRHRAGFAYSQLSQRYVGAEHVSFVIPPHFIRYNDVNQLGACESEYAHALNAYTEEVAALEAQLAFDGTECSKMELRKRVQQVARHVLPNATETKIVMTGNVRAWRHFFGMRGSPHADPEIRRLACNIFVLLRQFSPHFFQDITLIVDTLTDGWHQSLEVKHKKV